MCLQISLSLARKHPHWPAEGPITVCEKAPICEINGTKFSAVTALRTHLKGGTQASRSGGAKEVELELPPSQEFHLMYVIILI